MGERNVHEGTHEAGSDTNGDCAAETYARELRKAGFGVGVGECSVRRVVLRHVGLVLLWYWPIWMGVYWVWFDTKMRKTFREQRIIILLSDVDVRVATLRDGCFCSH